MNKYNPFKINSPFLFVACVCLTSCMPVTTPVATGYLIDSPVQGLQYVTPTQSGITGKDGSFKYLPGENIQFMLGSVLFPTVVAGTTITPLDLANSSLVNNPTALNIAIFLQSIDADQNPANGITISQATRDMAVGLVIDFTKTQVDFNKDTKLDNWLISLGLTLVEQAIAKDHLEISLSGLWKGKNFSTVINDGLSENTEIVTHGLGYISKELTGQCYQYIAWIYGVFPLVIDICYEGNGTGTVTVNQIQSDMVWSINQEAGVSIAVAGPLGGVTNIQISRLENGTPLLKVERLPIDIEGLPELININTVADFFLLGGF